MLFAGSYAQAHAGHDHSHWLSTATHVILAASIVSVLFVTYKLTFSKKFKKDEENL